LEDEETRGLYPPEEASLQEVTNWSEVRLPLTQGHETAVCLNQ